MQRRRSIRLAGYDYSSPRAYFVTLLSRRHENVFGEIVDEDLKLNETGFLVQNEWQRLPNRFPMVRLDTFVVMPDHLHGIICIVETGDVKASEVRARQKKESTSGNSPLASPVLHGPSSGSLGSIVGAFKSTTTRLINSLRHTPGVPVWQRNYYERIVRNENEWRRIRDYIEANPANWQLDNK